LSEEQQIDGNSEHGAGEVFYVFSDVFSNSDDIADNDKISEQ
jgi:hypothetical protein